MSNAPAVVRACAVAALALLVPSSAAAQLRAEVVATGFQRPLLIVPDPAAPNTLIVGQQDGLIRAVVNGVVQPTPFLDLRGMLTVENEEGLLGLAFAPHDPNQVFVSFNNIRDPNAVIRFPTVAHGDTVVARFLRSPDPLVLDATSRFDFVWPPPLPGLPSFPFIYQPKSVHKGGNLVFGPDGFLYIGIGDGGAFGSDPLFSAQKPQTLLGKMIRIDVNVPPDHPTGYNVPPDNPFRDSQPIAALGEIWAFGYRNPWRFSFDDYGEGATGAMIVADVGQDFREEVNYEPAGRGGRNYGWFIREGSIGTPGISPTTPPAYGPLTPPMVDYPRDIGRSVTGGYVYRGSGLPWLYRGRYFVADFFGGVYSLGLATDAAGEGRVTDVWLHATELGNPRLIPTFGRDASGELYFSSFMGGSVYKIVPDTPPLPAPPANFTASVTGSSVTLSWQPDSSAGPTMAYTLEAGSASGAADLLVHPTLTPGLSVSGVGNGLYYVRVRSHNSSGASAPSEEIPVRVGCGPPPAPSGLTSSVGPGGFVSVSWKAASSATGYFVDVGSTPGASDLAAFRVDSPSIAGVVPSRTYYIRIRATSACGTSTPSSEIAVLVP